MKPKEFFLSLNKNGISDEAWNYLQTEIIPDVQLEELTEGNVYFRETAKALNTFYPDSLSESIKLNLKSILEKTEPKPEREPEPEPIEDVTLSEPAPEPAKPKTSKKEVKAAVQALTTALRYAKDKKKFNSIKQAIKTLKLQVKYMKDGEKIKYEKGGTVGTKINFSGHTFKINEQGVVKEIRNFYTQKMVKEFNLNGVIYTRNYAYNHYTSSTNEILQKSDLK